MRLPFTLVSTVFNEAKRIDTTIADMERQTRAATEIIIVDAGSTDGTIEKLLAWKERSKSVIKVIVQKGCNVAEGRNIAIRHASYALIASTDFGCRFHPQWLESIMTPFEHDETLQVVGGAYNVPEEDVQNLPQRADYVLQNGYQLKIDDSFSVSSRSIAYKKEVWEKIGGYPEWLTLAADDTIFWRQIRKRNFKYQLIDLPYVYWMRHKTYKAFGKEAGRYGLGDGESGINMRTYVSHLIETAMRYTLVLHLIVMPFYISHNAWPLLFFIPQLFGLRSYKNAFTRWTLWRSEKYDFSVLLACFRMIEVSRWYYIRGYTKGLFSRDAEQALASKKLRTEIS